MQTNCDDKLKIMNSLVSLNHNITNTILSIIDSESNVRNSSELNTTTDSQNKFNEFRKIMKDKELLFLEAKKQFKL